MFIENLKHYLGHLNLFCMDYITALVYLCCDIMVYSSALRKDKKKKKKGKTSITAGLLKDADKDGFTKAVGNSL